MTIVQWLRQLGSRPPVVRAGCILMLWAAALPLDGSAQPIPQCAMPATPPMLPVNDCLLNNRRDDMASFATMSWQAFRFLTWPTEMKGGALPRPVRGQPAQNGTSLAGPPVFLTFKADWETFRARGTSPLAWPMFPASAEPCQDEPEIWPGELVLASVHEFSNVTEPEFKGLTNVLPAQNGEVIRYMTSFGPDEFGLIMKGALYDKSHVAHMGNGAPSADAQKLARAVMVKSAWVEITPGLHSSHPFYTQSALVQDFFTGTCRRAIVGLVGLHIAQKTPSSPQWIWSSFEHVDNLPESPGMPSTFNDGSGSPMPSQPPADTIVPSWTRGTPAPAFHPAPFNVERKQPIDPAIAMANTAWQARVRGVWANYQLVTVQWPGLPHLNEAANDAIATHPTPPFFSNGGTNMANTVIETFLQDGGDPAKVQHTCMGCHNGARTSDFVWALPINAQQGSRFGDDGSTHLDALRTLQGIVGQEKR